VWSEIALKLREHDIVANLLKCQEQDKCCCKQYSNEDCSLNQRVWDCCYHSTACPLTYPNVTPHACAHARILLIPTQFVSIRVRSEDHDIQFYRVAGWGQVWRCAASERSQCVASSECSLNAAGSSKYCNCLVWTKELNFSSIRSHSTDNR